MRQHKNMISPLQGSLLMVTSGHNMEAEASSDTTARLVQVILNHNNSHLHSCLFLLQMVGNLVLILPATITTSNPM